MAERMGDRVSRVTSLLSSSLGLSAIMVGSVFSLRVLFVAGFDPALAAVLITSTTATTLVTTTAVQVLPVFTLVAGVLLIGYAIRIWRSVTWRGGILLLLGGLALAFPGAMQMDPITAGFILPIWGVAAVLAGRETRTRPWLMFLGVVLAFSTLLVAVVGRGMWLPPERLMINGTPTTAYVLQDDGHDLVLFRPSPRSVERVSKSDVTARDYCSPGHRVRGDYLSDYLFGVPKLPVCPP